MVGKYEPKVVCPFCEKINWNYIDDTKRTKCKKCGKLIPKIIHTLNGGILSKKNQAYVLSFPEFKEDNYFFRWEDLQSEMNKIENLSKN